MDLDEVIVSALVLFVSLAGLIYIISYLSYKIKSKSE
jgi:hypothetical protein